jgi:GTP pyrophosphokinase
VPNKTLLAGLVKQKGAGGKTDALIEKAYRLAEKEGKGRLLHALRVAESLSEMGFDNTTIAAGLVHDIKEKEEIGKALGEELAGITKEYPKIEEIEKKNIGKISPNILSTVILATAKDLRTIFVRLAARLDVLQNQDPTPEEADTTISIYAPICQKLGLYEMQGLLEDNALKIKNPGLYRSIAKGLGKTREERKQEAEQAIDEFSNLMKKEEKQVSVQGRAKSIYSIYKKIEEQGKPFEEIYDILGIRIICDSIKECYEIVGIIHSEYKPVPNQFKDYIATPKKNGYRSIHTIIEWNQKPLEVQIRTWEMHYENETGLASHWQYKQYAKDKFFDTRLAWAKQLVEWHRDAQDKGSLAHSLKMHFDKNRIFVFTPKNEVVVLPENASPIDFAFAIHSDLGKKCQKAKVNGKIVPLSHHLENGDVVEIGPGKNVEVKRQWLTFAKSQKAQTKIKQVLGIKIPFKKTVEEKKHSTQTEDKNVRIAKCCNPVPGDEIVGIRTTKRKISVHRKNCKNAEKAGSSKKISVEWGLAGKDYIVGVRVRAKESPGLLPAILKAISGNKVAIESTDAKKTKNDILDCRFNLKIKNLEQLDKIIEKIRALPPVFNAERE